MHAHLKWNGGASFVAETGSGHALVLDGPPDHGGRNIGPRPMEMLLVGLGGCTAFDVVDILKKARQPVRDVTVTVDAERADSVPAVFTRIAVHFKVFGRGLRESHVRRAVELSAEKYCSASLMLQRGGVEISHSWAIVEDDPA